MKLRTILTSILLVASTPTWAVDLDLGQLSVPSVTLIGNSFDKAGIYTDTFDFSILSAANAGGLILEFDPSRSLDLAVTAVSLSGVSGSIFSLVPGLLSYSFGSVAAGAYTLAIESTVTGSSGKLGVGYLGSLTLTTASGRVVTAPEPATLALYGLGLLAVVFSARRAKVRRAAA
jgi:PEP-CTERM motif